MSSILSIVIVNWNVRDLLKQAITAISSSWGNRPGLEIIVVDNASNDDSVAMLAREFPEVHIIANRENRGFTGANNQGMQAANGEYVLLLNPDTEIVADALSTLVTYMQEHPEVGMLGPQLLYPDGTVQSSRRHFPTLAILFLESTWLQGLAPRRMLRHYYAQESPDHRTCAVDWITGAAMLTRREIIAEVGGMDETFFMYSEELDWCKRIKQAGWEIVYYPDAKIIHYEGKSSEQVVPARHIYFQSSKVHYARKYHGRFWAEALRLWLMGQYTLQIMIEGAKWLLGNRRGLRVARIGMYRKVLRSKLRQSGPVIPAAKS